MQSRVYVRIEGNRQCVESDIRFCRMMECGSTPNARFLPPSLYHSLLEFKLRHSVLPCWTLPVDYYSDSPPLDAIGFDNSQCVRGCL